MFSVKLLVSFFTLAIPLIAGVVIDPAARFSTEMSTGSEPSILSLLGIATVLALAPFLRRRRR